MASNQIIYAGILLCFSVMSCNGWVVRRQGGNGEGGPNQSRDSSSLKNQCAISPESCVSNSYIFVPLLSGVGYSRLVVDGRFQMKCEEEDFNDFNQCFQRNSNGCLEHFPKDLVFSIITTMCNDAEKYVNGSQCWNNGLIGIPFTQCVHRERLQSNYCGVPDCLRGMIPTTPHCTATEAGLIADITTILLAERPDCGQDAN